MNQHNQISIKFIGLVFSLSLVLSGCLDIAYDITPPPDDSQFAGATESTPPTLIPTLVIPPTPPLSTSEVWDGGVINVFIADHTGGTLLEKGLDVRLEGYDQFEQVYQDAQSITAVEQVQFLEVPFQTGRVFFASVSYDGAIYRSAMVEPGDDATSLQLTVEIYETTTSDEGLTIDRLHVLIDFPQPDMVQVAEIYIMSNFDPATFVAEVPGEASVRFSLPPEALNIEFDDGVLGQRYLKTEDGFSDTVSVPPGSGVYQVMVYYTLPYLKNQVDFKQVMNYPVGAVVVMIPEGEVIITGSTLEDKGVQDIPNAAIHLYSGTPINKGGTLEFQISGKSGLAGEVVDPAAPLPQSQPLLIGMGVLGSALLLSGVWLFVRNRRQDIPEDEDTGTETREELLDAIIALDDLFQTGEIDKNIFQQKRKLLKEKLESFVED